MIHTIAKGIFRGILVAVLTGLGTPFFISGITFVVEVINHTNIVLPVLVLPGLFLVTCLLSFVGYLLPCIILGIVLEYLRPRKYLSILALILICGISSYFVWVVIFPGLGYPPDRPITITMVIIFQYLCFFKWMRPKQQH